VLQRNGGVTLNVRSPLLLAGVSICRARLIAPCQTARATSMLGAATKQTPLRVSRLGVGQTPFGYETTVSRKKV